MKHAINKAIHNLHVPLPPSLYKELKEKANRSGQPATTLARLAIQSWLRQQKRVERNKDIAAYAARMAGTSADLDEELEAAAVEHLLETTEP